MKDTPVILQINATANWGSTGKIAEQINNLAQQSGWETYIAYGRSHNCSQSHLIPVGSKAEVYEHYLEHRLFDNDGLASRRATKKLVRRIKEIQPDIIHLHNIHDHWLNYRILFDYLNTLDVPIVWTQHDCWSFTGDCGYFSLLQCSQWKDGCTNDCPFRKGKIARSLINYASDHYNLKKQLFTATKNVTLVPVSKWLEDVIRNSFLKDKKIHTIFNGVDLNMFHPFEAETNVLRKYGLDGQQYVVGVASIWSGRKGLTDYFELSSRMPNSIKIALVGLDDKKKLEAEEHGIIGVSRTDSVDDLATIYNGASVVLNLSYEETFGLTTVEGFACGTPGIVYNTTASPELITPETGIVVEPGDIEGVAKAIQHLCSKEKPVESCRNRAVRYYNQDDRYSEYINLYKELLKK